MEMQERKRWVFLGLPFTFTKYHFSDELLTITEGFFTRKENSCYMYRITDVELKKSLGERIFGLGTITCFTSDTTHPTLQILHIKHSRDVKNMLLETTEAHRIKRRTVNMQNLDADNIEDIYSYQD
ncbi:MAG: PH domain-containing protein [Clostridia bacterium]